MNASFGDPGSSGLPRVAAGGDSNHLISAMRDI